MPTEKPVRERETGLVVHEESLPEDRTKNFLQEIGFSPSFPATVNDFNRRILDLLPEEERNTLEEVTLDWPITDNSKPRVTTRYYPGMHALLSVGYVRRDGKRVPVTTFVMGSKDEKIRDLNGAASFLDLQSLFGEISNKVLLCRIGAAEDEEPIDFIAMSAEELQKLEAYRYNIMSLTPVAKLAVGYNGLNCQISDFYCAGPPSEVERVVRLFYNFLSDREKFVVINP